MHDLAYWLIPIVSIFRRQYLGEKKDLSPSSVSVLKGVSPRVLFTSIHVISLTGAKKILSEYSNNRNSLMSKTVLLEKGQFVQFSAH